MMNENFIIKLEARNPDKGNLRAYKIDARKDLFGHWFIHDTYGRIGRPWRTVTYSSSNDQEAKQVVKQDHTQYMGFPHTTSPLCINEISCF